MGYPWQIKQATSQRAKSPADIVDVWIPPK
jgi:hypothetical protein